MHVVDASLVTKQTALCIRCGVRSSILTRAWLGVCDAFMTTSSLISSRWINHFGGENSLESAFPPSPHECKNKIRSLHAETITSRNVPSKRKQNFTIFHFLIIINSFSLLSLQRAVAPIKTPRSGLPACFMWCLARVCACYGVRWEASSSTNYCKSKLYLKIASHPNIYSDEDSGAFIVYIKSKSRWAKRRVLSFCNKFREKYQKTASLPPL